MSGLQNWFIGKCFGSMFHQKSDFSPEILKQNSFETFLHPCCTKYRHRGLPYHEKGSFNFFIMWSARVTSKLESFSNAKWIPQWVIKSQHRKLYYHTLLTYCESSLRGMRSNSMLPSLISIFILTDRLHLASLNILDVLTVNNLCILLHMVFNQFPLVKHLIPLYTLTAQNKKGPAFSVSVYERRVSWKL